MRPSRRYRDPLSTSKIREAAGSRLVKKYLTLVTNITCGMRGRFIIVEGGAEPGGPMKTLSLALGLTLLSGAFAQPPQQGVIPMPQAESSDSKKLGSVEGRV